MKNRIFILEDNQEHWSCIKKMLNTDNDLKNFYPKNDNEFRAVKINFLALCSTDSSKSHSAKEQLQRLIKPDDFLLMDFILKLDDKQHNCISIYKQLDLSNKGMVYTGMLSVEYSKIEEEITNDNNLSKKIKIAMKPADLLTDCDIPIHIKYLCDKIKEANDEDNSDEKIKPYKP